MARTKLEDVTADPLPERFAAYIATLRNAGERPSMARYPGLRSIPWHDPATIPAADELERAAPQIAAEFRRLDASAFVPEREPIARQGSWDVFMLYERGRRHEERCRLFPSVTAILDRQRTVRTMAGLVYFSRLAPHTRVAPHCGPTNMRVRAHLGIDIPPNCGIRVGQTSTTWNDGRCIVFDDSFSHEVWNESERDRIVLVMDLWHPDLTDDEVRLLDGFQRYVEYAARGLERYWAANER
jgi:aspartyl/asparaginyl beta-hydroxylase (cupin superfamily)